MTVQSKKLSEVHPYENNPRRNDGAVGAVAESIRQCGYIAPIIVDENGVILAGHTRYKALRQLGYQEADVVVKSGLTEEQKRKYRLLDNKTGELAEWDIDLLEMELDGLDFGSLDLDWGISSAEGLDLDEAASTQSEQEETETIHCPKCGFEFAV
ncbi:MAG TPA: ParB N-terminal domain-containing protein [Candidatus Onthomonas avicola]|nr:ParB N-terminal domain-containing protein [Candidatus Onthomonas avicola]